jgi:hypothetical protein
MSDAGGVGGHVGPARSRSPFVAGARLRRADAERILAAVALIAARVTGASGHEARLGLGRLDRLAKATLEQAGRPTGATTVIGLGDGLDLAAGLLECADSLADVGWSVEAFALEGIEGRLLEALLDAGALADGVCGNTSR